MLSNRMKHGKCLLSNGRLYYHSPYFVFVKDNPSATIESLNRCGLINCEQADELYDIESCFQFYLSTWDDWTLIMDNWYYSLWHLNQRSSIIDNWGKDKELYQCHVGDCDYSFGFKYHKNGRVVRTYQVSNQSCRKGDLKIEEDIGEPFLNESVYLLKDGEYQKVINIAYDLGLGFPPEPDQIYCYSYDLSDELKMIK